MTADEALRLLYLPLKLGKPEQNPGGGGFSQGIKDQVTQIRGKNGGSDDFPEVEMPLMGEQTSQNQGGFSFKEGPGKNNQITIFLEKVE